MKRQYTKPETANVQIPESLMDNGLVMKVSQKETSNEASRESKFGIEESDTEDHENFWDE